MTIIEQRNQAVAETVDRVRLIEQQHGVNYEALGKIRNELIELTRDKELFPRSSFPIADDVDRRSIEFLKIQTTAMHSMHLLVLQVNQCRPTITRLGQSSWVSTGMN